MPKTNWGWQITPCELESWIIRCDPSLLVVNKPAHVVCHPSKQGPWSSLVGACREFLSADCLHMVSRLDRETSGVVVIARSPSLARELGLAMQARQVEKRYRAILEGALAGPITVEAPVGPDSGSSFVARQAVVEGGQPALTEFKPVTTNSSYTLAEIHPLTGRRHQIRVHAAHIGHPVLGDKLYGPDETIMLRFITEGFTPDMEQKLKLDRQALHASEIAFPTVLPGEYFRAQFPPELECFCAEAAITSQQSG